MTTQQPTHIFSYKRDADKAMRILSTEYGGIWSIEIYGDPKYHVVQQATKWQVEHAREVENASRVLTDERFAWWDAESWHGFSRFEMEAKTVCAKFAERFANNPFDAMRWGTDAVEAAAMLKALALIKYYHDKGVSDGDIADELEQTVSRATSLSQSPSPMAALAERAEIIAAGKLAAALRSHIEYQYNAMLTVASDATYR